ncbi:MAG: hypothetical protein E7633_05875 [Ruminococcaceae bacterium]|nr:hypothetical protein [Oscillospiraceae bacterium]
MLSSKSPAKKLFLVFFAIYIVVAASVVAFIFFRIRYAKYVSEDTRRRNRVLAARRAEAENQKRLLDQLRGFICPESFVDVQAQREIVIMSKAGQTNEEIAKQTTLDIKEIEAIVASFKRYVARIDSEEGSADIILSPAQQEEIVVNIINSIPTEHGISTEEYWTKNSVRNLASAILGMNVSTRIMSAYLRHWDIAVPTNKTIKARRENPVVANWLVGEFEDIRVKCKDEGGEIIWIYTLKPDAVHDISKNIPVNSTLLMAVTNDGFARFKFYASNEKAIFTKFTNSLVSSASCKYFAVVNENFDEYMDELGRVSIRALSDRIEFFKAI